MGDTAQTSQRSFWWRHQDIVIKVEKMDGEWVAAYYVKGELDAGKTYHAGDGSSDAKADAIAVARNTIKRLQDGIEKPSTSGTNVDQRLACVMCGEEFTAECDEQETCNGCLDDIADVDID